jgi:hypothetical protein
MAEIVTNRAVEQSAVDDWSRTNARPDRIPERLWDGRGWGRGQLATTTEVRAYGRSARRSEPCRGARQVQEARGNREFYV